MGHEQDTMSQFTIDLYLYANWSKYPVIYWGSASCTYCDYHLDCYRRISNG